MNKKKKNWIRARTHCIISIDPISKDLFARYLFPIFTLRIEYILSKNKTKMGNEKLHTSENTLHNITAIFKDPILLSVKPETHSKMYSTTYSKIWKHRPLWSTDISEYEMKIFTNVHRFSSLCHTMRQSLTMFLFCIATIYCRSDW